MESESNKRKKSSFFKQNYKKCKPNKGLLAEGMTGFIVTCNFKEYHCLKEGYNLLNEFADKLYGNNALKTEPDVDIETAVQNEINSIKNNEKRFQQMITKCNNVLFIKSNDKSVDPLVICSEILKEIETNGKQLTQQLLRLIPIVTTFESNSNFDEIIETNLEKQTKESISFVIQCKVRNNSKVKKMDLIERVVTIVKKVRPDWTVDFSQPKLTIDLEVLHKTICLSFLKDYQNYCKYNLIEFSKKCLKRLEETLKTEIKEEDIKIETNI